MAEKRSGSMQHSSSHNAPPSKKQKHSNGSSNRGWKNQHNDERFQAKIAPHSKLKVTSSNIRQVSEGHTHNSSKSKGTARQSGQDQILQLYNNLNTVIMTSVASSACDSLLDEETLSAARNLQDLLSKRSYHSSSSTTFNSKYPEVHIGSNVYISEVPPAFAPTCLDLPPLPPIPSFSLLQAVFTHSSVGHGMNYETLEFLGDAYIEIIATRLIHTRLDFLDLSRQVQVRESIVKNTTLATYAGAYGMGDRIIAKSDNFKADGWKKVLADVFEAYVAGVVLSNGEKGFEIVENWLVEVWSEKLLEILPGISKKADGGSKVELAKMVLTPGVKLDYKTERDEAQAEGSRKFIVNVYLMGWDYEHEFLGEGTGKSVKEAGMAAARDAIIKNSDALRRAQDLKKKADEKKREQREREEQESRDERGTG